MAFLDLKKLFGRANLKGYLHKLYWDFFFNVFYVPVTCSREKLEGDEVKTEWWS